jgi:2-polyprenyl-6-methoxyphenol hydroxylase-like FAD-dependent oxidoreductase
MTTNKSVLISGASVAGPALAYWLRRYGFTPTVVERAPAPRPGGYAVDFRGAAMTALRRMGILDAVRARATNLGDLTYFAGDGRRVARLPSVALSGELEILRGDLVAILYDLTRHDVEYLFDDTITSLHQDASGVHVTFESAPPRRFDLVVGADGLHSTVRRLTFGEEPAHTKDLGLYGTVFTAPNHLGLDRVAHFYNVPGKVAGMYSARDNSAAKVLMYFASEPLPYDRHDVDAQKRLVAEAFAGVGWEVPRMIDAIWPATDLFFDRISQIRLDRHHHGRIALVGDAGYCASPLSGMGTSLALVGAHVLAGELAFAGGDPAVAFPRYESELAPYIKACQDQAIGGGKWFVPGSRSWLWFRNLNLRLMNLMPGDGIVAKIALKAANTITLKEYAPAA